MIIRTVALLLLCHASVPVFAAENEDDGCPSAVIGIDDRDGGHAAAAHGADADHLPGDKTSPARRGGDAESGMRGARMHNLLPGMFR